MLLELKPLGGALLDDVGIGHRRGEVVLKAQAPGVLDQVSDIHPELFERRRDGAKTGANNRLDVEPRVMDRHPQAVAGGIRGPPDPPWDETRSSWPSGRPAALASTRWRATARRIAPPASKES